jgi:hypothetical protein
VVNLVMLDGNCDGNQGRQVDRRAGPQGQHESTLLTQVHLRSFIGRSPLRMSQVSW